MANTEADAVASGILLNVISRVIIREGPGRTRGISTSTRVEIWEGISRPGNGRDGIGGKNPLFLISGDIPGEG